MAMMAALSWWRMFPINTSICGEPPKCFMVSDRE
jgi:hypothetical protein